MKKTSAAESISTSTVTTRTHTITTSHAAGSDAISATDAASVSAEPISVAIDLGAASVSGKGSRALTEDPAAPAACRDSDDPTKTA